MTPTTPMEARVIAVSEALEIGYVSPETGWDWTKVFDAAARGTTYRVSANTNFFKYLLMEYPGVYDKLKPFLQLSAQAEQRLLARHQELKAAKEPAA